MFCQLEQEKEHWGEARTIYQDNYPDLATRLESREPSAKHKNFYVSLSQNENIQVDKDDPLLFPCEVTQELQDSFREAPGKPRERCLEEVTFTQIEVITHAERKNSRKGVFDFPVFLTICFYEHALNIKIFIIHPTKTQVKGK